MFCRLLPGDDDNVDENSAAEEEEEEAVADNEPIAAVEEDNNFPDNNRFDKMDNPEDIPYDEPPVEVGVGPVEAVQMCSRFFRKVRKVLRLPTSAFEIR